MSRFDLRLALRKSKATSLALVSALSVIGFAVYSQSPQKKTFRPDQMDTILYGAAYYPEYMPYERTDEDIALMKKAGINVFRVGESTWGLW